MKAAAVKSNKQKESRAAANSIFQKKNDQKGALGFGENRPGPAADRQTTVPNGSAGSPKFINRLASPPLSKEWNNTKRVMQSKNNEANITRYSQNRCKRQEAIQRKGHYTDTLNFLKVGSENIAELEHGQGNLISFTNMTSCIGLIGRVGEKLDAVHLPIVDKNGISVTQVTPQEVYDTLNVFLAGSNPLYLVGENRTWKREASEIYQKIITLSNLTQLYPFGGKYKAHIHPKEKNEIVVYHNDEKIWPY